MSQYSNVNDPSAQIKRMAQNRVILLSQKIDNLKFGHKAQSQKRMGSIERNCQQIEDEIQKIRNNFDHNCFDVKHLIDKIQKELSYDYYGTDKMVKDEIRRSEERFIQMTQTHMADRKRSDVKLAKFMQEKTIMLRDLIDKEIRERTAQGQAIEQSLTQDLIDIKSNLEEQKQANQQGLQTIHEQFLAQYQKMQSQFDEIRDKTSQNQNQFYKMLRDILKKVKQELGQDKIKREEMEETILTLIQKICDKAIEEVGA